VAKLDRTKPFGEVCGHTEDGTRYYQFEKRFDANGNEIADKPAKRVKAAPVEPTSPVDEVLK